MNSSDGVPARSRAGRHIGIPLGRIGGIPVVLSLSWLLSVLVVAVLAAPVVSQAVPGIGGSQAVLVAAGLGVLLGVSVLAHELGHCLAARSMGIPVVEVRLYLLGGVSTLGRLPRSPREEAAIAAAGPGVSAILAGVFGLLVGSTTAHTVPWLLLIELALANLVVAIFNFLPALPLDGGRVLRAGVWQVSGDRRSGTVAAVVGGYAIAVALLVWGVRELLDVSRSALLQGGIAAMMGLFVGAGAVAEHRSARRTGGAPQAWPSGADLGRLAFAVVQLPAESTIGHVGQVAAGRPVLLTGLDGVAVGLVDPAAAIELARVQPDAPASTVATPITPEMILFEHDQPPDIAERLRLLPSSTRFLLVDDSGRPAGVVLGTDIARILSRRGGS